jgi:hypothetical protein
LDFFMGRIPKLNFIRIFTREENKPFADTKRCILKTCVKSCALDPALKPPTPKPHLDFP